MSWSAFERIATESPEQRWVVERIEGALQSAGATPVLDSHTCGAILGIDSDIIARVFQRLKELRFLTESEQLQCSNCREAVLLEELVGSETSVRCIRCGVALKDQLPLKSKLYRLADEALVRPEPQQLQKFLAGKARVGIITALDKEAAAVRVTLDGCSPYIVRSPRGQAVYDLGTVPSLGGDPHPIIHVSLHGDAGTNPAASAAAQLFLNLPKLELILVVGIAGGCPNPQRPEEHVRLGDVVVSNRSGVVQYDNLKRELHGDGLRPPPRPPSKELLDSVGRLAQDELLGDRRWLSTLSRGERLWNAARPADATDVLDDSPTQASPRAHPADPQRRPGEPRVFRGAIGSANILLKDPEARDQLRDRFGVRAIEMESSGATQAAWEAGVGYLVVRGISDYCNPGKTDLWQEHAALVAAAYARALLAKLPNRDR
jgi:nucleoside phosphorylase